MNENYIMLNGKRVDLTEEQLEKLGLKVETNKFSECFQSKYNNIYFYIDNTGDVKETKNSHYILDAKRYDTANYCADESIMQQRALHETLNRLLWRFSMQNDGDKIDWSNHTLKFYIYYDKVCTCFGVSSNDCRKSSNTYFYTREIAQRAIDEIVLPFMKEHPEFVW